MRKNKRRFFEKPWSYTESFFITLSIFFSAIFFEMLTGFSAPHISFPYSLIVLISIAGTCIALHVLSKKHTYLAWFSGIPASIGALALFLSLTLIMALVPQVSHATDYIFIFNVTSSWAYYLSTLYLLLVLGMVTIKRLQTINRSNIIFFLNHAGLWITIATASLGAGDIQKYRMTLTEGKTEWRGFDTQNAGIELDFALMLLSFEMEEYPAKIAFADPRNGKILTQKRKSALFEVDTLSKIYFNNYELTIKKHFSNSIFFAKEFHPIDEYGASQSYYIHVSDSLNRIDTSGWISAGSVIQQAQHLILNDSIAVSVLTPQAKRYTSFVKIYKKDGTVYHDVIEVNKPITIDGYKIYQTGYDEEKGKWSKISIVEIVRDPWLPFVYFGIFLFTLGTILIIWFGKKR